MYKKSQMNEQFAASGLNCAKKPPNFVFAGKIPLALWLRSLSPFRTWTHLTMHTDWRFHLEQRNGKGDEPSLGTEMAAAPSRQDPITFPEIALHFSSEERALLSPHQRLLFEAVTVENYENVKFVAFIWGQYRKKEGANIFLLVNSPHREEVL